MKKWTKDEMEVLRQVYPSGGKDGVHALLPHRSRFSIKGVAARLGVFCDEAYIKAIQSNKSCKGRDQRSLDADLLPETEITLRDIFLGWLREAPRADSAPHAWRV